MREEILHHLWKYKKIFSRELKTTGGELLLLLDTGAHNHDAGPDFFNSRIIIGEQEWAGNVEMHISSSDWYSHGHEKDANYDNVILHVVWNHDVEVFRKDNSAIPVLELKSFISEESLSFYTQLLENKTAKWINCEADFPVLDDFVVQNWLERLYLERLEQKTRLIFERLEQSSNNWEEVLFQMLAKNFGLNMNGEAFLSLATSIPFSVVRKLRKKSLLLEALFLGQAGLLEGKMEEARFQELQRNYAAIRHKFSLVPAPIPVAFFRLRPDNFPNLRLVQLASLYQKRDGLFSEVMGANSRQELYQLFEVEVPTFWENHYTFRKTHRKRKKPLSRNFIDLLIINTLIPLKYCFAKYQGRAVDDEILTLVSSLRQESNGIVKKYNSLRPKTARNAMQSQALLQLKHNYCDRNNCLNCSLGVKVLQRERQM